VCVCVVFAQEEAWAEGMEWEIVDFLTGVYGALVFGDTRGGDGSILPHAAGTAAAAAAAAAQGQGQGGRFGSMTQWHGQGQGRKAPPPLTTTTQLPTLQGDNGSGDHPGMISDFPRQVCVDGGRKQASEPFYICLRMHVPNLLSVWLVQVLLSLPAAHAPGAGLGALVGHFEQQMLASPSKKKRRELLKELLKAVDRGRGGPSGAGSAGGAGAAGAGARGVLDIRRRMTVRFAPSPAKDARAGLLGAGGDFDLSAFFGD